MINKLVTTNKSLKSMYIDKFGEETEYASPENVLIDGAMIVYDNQTITLAQCMRLYTLFINLDEEIAMHFMNLK